MNKSKNTLIRFVIVLTALTLIGFVGYYFGFLKFIYNVMMPEVFSNFPLIILAMLFGLASFFSPCSLTVSPSYVSHYLAQDTQDQRKALAKGLYFGFIAALGILTVNIVIGLIVAILGSTAPFAKDPRQDIPLILGIRIVAGILIAYLGLLTVLRKPFEIPFIQSIIGRASPKAVPAARRMSFRKSIFLYGLLYNGAAIGCTGPILLGLILYALTSGSFVSALTAFLVFALTMGMLMVFITVLISVFKATVVRHIIPFTPIIQKTAGYVMIIVGTTIALLTLEGNKIFVKIFFPFLE